MPILKILSVPLLLFLPGFLFVRVFCKERNPAVFLLAVPFSIPFTAVAGFILAALGLLSLPALAIADAVVAACLFLLRGRSGISLGALFSNRYCLALLLIAVGLFLYYSPPFEYYLGGRDPGIYVVNGIRIARTGAMFSPDPLVRQIDPKDAQLFFSLKEPVRYMGFKIDSLDNGIIVPDFFYLYPTWFAVFYLLFGVHGMLYATPFLACMMLLLSALFARLTILPEGPGSLGVPVLLGCSAIYLWFARQPNSEILAGFLVFVSLFSLEMYSRDKSVALGLLGGACLALAFWTRIDAILLTVPLMLFFAFRWIEAPDRRDLWVAAAYLVFLVSGAAYIAIHNDAYVLTAFENLRFKPVKVAAVLLAVGTLILFSAWVFKRYRLNDRPATGNLLAGSLAVLLLYAYFIRPFYPASNLGSPNAGAFLALGWYFTHPLVVLALLGFVWSVRDFRSIRWIFFSATVIYATLYFYRIRAHADHFWMLRRYLMIICPAIALYAIYALRQILDLPRLKARLTAARASAIILVACAALAGLFLWQDRPLHHHQEYSGSYSFVESLARRLQPQDLLLIGSREGNDLHIVGPLLSYYFDRNVLVIRNSLPDLNQLSEFVGKWKGKVYFAGAGNTNLAGGNIPLAPLQEIRFETPVFDELYHARPKTARSKYFQFGWYSLGGRAPNPYLVDIGGYDDGSTTNFYIKEGSANHKYRWTNGEGHVYFPPADRNIASVKLCLNPGPWVPGMERVRVKIYANELFVSEVTLGVGYQDYTVAVPALISQKLQGRPLDLRIESRTWIPKRVLNLPDLRRLGVIVDRVQLNFSVS